MNKNKYYLGLKTLFNNGDVNQPLERRKPQVNISQIKNFNLLPKLVNRCIY